MRIISEYYCLEPISIRAKGGLKDGHFGALQEGERLKILSPPRFHKSIKYPITLTAFIIESLLA